MGIWICAKGDDEAQQDNKEDGRAHGIPSWDGDTASGTHVHEDHVGAVLHLLLHGLCAVAREPLRGMAAALQQRRGHLAVEGDVVDDHAPHRRQHGGCRRWSRRSRGRRCGCCCCGDEGNRRERKAAALRTSGGWRARHQRRLGCVAHGGLGRLCIRESSGGCEKLPCVGAEGGQLLFRLRLLHRRPQRRWKCLCRTGGSRRTGVGPSSCRRDAWRRRRQG